MDDVPAWEISELAAFYSLREKDRYEETARQSYEAAVRESVNEPTLSPNVLGAPKPQAQLPPTTDG